VTVSGAVFARLEAHGGAGGGGGGDARWEVWLDAWRPEDGGGGGGGDGGGGAAGGNGTREAEAVPEEGARLDASGVELVCEADNGPRGGASGAAALRLASSLLTLRGNCTLAAPLSLAGPALVDGRGAAGTPRRLVLGAGLAFEEAAFEASGANASLLVRGADVEAAGAVRLPGAARLEVLDGAFTSRPGSRLRLEAVLEAPEAATEAGFGKPPRVARHSLLRAAGPVRVAGAVEVVWAWAAPGGAPGDATRDAAWLPPSAPPPRATFLSSRLGGASSAVTAGAVSVRGLSPAAFALETAEHPAADGQRMPAWSDQQEVLAMSFIGCGPR
jgi:hypothetical protein